MDTVLLAYAGIGFAAHIYATVLVVRWLLACFRRMRRASRMRPGQGREMTARAVAVVHVPHAVPCANCPGWIRPAGPDWVHIGGAKPCRDSAGVDTGYYAAPRTVSVTQLDR